MVRFDSLSRRFRSCDVAFLCVLLVSASPLPGQDNLVLKSQTANQAMAERRFTQAVQLYSELVRAIPDNPGMLMNLGLALHSAGRYREAIPQFAAALKLQPDLTAAKFLTGMSRLKLGEPLAAIAPLSEAVQAEPANPLFRLELADSLLSPGRFSESATHFRKLAELTPQDPRAWQGLGLSYLGLGRQTFEALEKRAPDSEYVLVLLANTRVKEQQYRSAFALYRRALERNGGLRGVHAAVAAIYRATGHAGWADVEEDRERRLPPPDCSAASAECAFQAGHHEQVIAMPDSRETLYWKNRSYSELAVTALQQLLRLPPSPQIHELMAEALDLQGEHRQAANELREALQLAPGDRRLEELLAKTLWRSRDFGQAGPLLEKLLRADPNSAELNFQLGDVLLQQEEAEKAIPWLEKAVKIRPGLLSAHASLARAYVRAGQPAAAIPHYKAALPLDDDGSLHFQLARACEGAGNSTLAQQAMRQFEEISRSKASMKSGLGQESEITAPPGVR
jgi:tetratricopeptide (TPR) repeat protein